MIGTEKIPVRYLTPQGERVAPDKIVLIMKNGIQAVAGINDCLFIFSFNGSGYGWEHRGRELFGWLREGGEWRRDNLFPVSIRQLATPSLLAGSFSNEIAKRIHVDRESTKLRTSLTSENPVLPSMCGKIIGDFLEGIGMPEVLALLADNDFSIDEGWTLLMLLMRRPEAAEMLHQNPALAYLLFETARDWDDLDRLIKGSRRMIAGRFGFRESNESVRILSKLTPPVIRRSYLTSLKEAMECRGISRLLCHLQRITPHIIRIISIREAAPFLTGRLLQEISDHENSNIGNEISEIFQHAGEIPGFRCQLFRTSKDVHSCYQRVMEWVYQREGSWLYRRGPLPPAPLRGIEDVITGISEIEDLALESREMMHCIISYADRIRSGLCYVYRLHRPERATICIEQDARNGGWRINDVRLKRNGQPSQQSLQIVGRWLELSQQNVSTCITELLSAV